MSEHDSEWRSVQSSRKVRWVHRIEDRLAGKLIGPKGSRIKEIRKTSGAEITVVEIPDDQEREVTVMGRQQQVAAAVDMVCATLGLELADALTEFPPDTSETSEVPNQPQQRQAEDESLLVPLESVSRLIGKAGVVINRIRVQSGCRQIHICDEDNDDCTREVLIRGDADSRSRAKVLIQEALSEQAVTAQARLEQSAGAAAGASQDVAEEVVDDELNVYADYMDFAHKEEPPPAERRLDAADDLLASGVYRLYLAASGDGVSPIPEGQQRHAAMNSLPMTAATSDPAILQLSNAKASLEQAQRAQQSAQVKWDGLILEARARVVTAQSVVGELRTELERISSALKVALQDEEVGTAALEGLVTQRWDVEQRLSSDVVEAQSAMDAVKAQIQADVAKLEAEAAEKRRALGMTS